MTPPVSLSIPSEEPAAAWCPVLTLAALRRFPSTQSYAVVRTGFSAAANMVLLVAPVCLLQISDRVPSSASYTPRLTFEFVTWHRATFQRGEREVSGNRP